MVSDVNHGEEDAEVVFSLEVAYPAVDVFGVKAMVFQAGNRYCKPLSATGP